MKIAVPSNDNTTLSQHFGRTKGFIIFQISEGKILSTEYRFNTLTRHVPDQQHQCGPNPGQCHDGDPDHHGKHGHHSHNRILDGLSDCEVVISGGMGYRLLEDLKGAGKNIYITQQENARIAVELFLNNELTNNKDACCH